MNLCDRTIKASSRREFLEKTGLGFGALAAGYYFAMRPVTLRIAVGPANSDDLRVVQALTQAFNNQQRSLVRLRPADIVPEPGAEPVPVG